MNWIQRWLRRFIPPTIRERTLLLPMVSTVTAVEYREACERVMAGPDGKILLRVFKEKYFEALTMECPHTDREARLLWLSYHETLLACRREIHDDFELNLELLPLEGEPEQLTAMRMREGVAINE